MSLKENLNQAKQRAERRAREVFTEEKRIKNNKDFYKLKQSIYRDRLKKENLNANEAKVFDLIKHSKRKKNQKDMLGVIQRQQLHRQQKLKQKQKRTLRASEFIKKKTSGGSMVKKTIDKKHHLPKFRKS